MLTPTRAREWIATVILSAFVWSVSTLLFKGIPSLEEAQRDYDTRLVPILTQLELSASVAALTDSVAKRATARGALTERFVKDTFFLRKRGRYDLASDSLARVALDNVDSARVDSAIVASLHGLQLSPSSRWYVQSLERHLGMEAAYWRTTGELYWSYTHGGFKEIEVERFFSARADYQLANSVFIRDVEVALTSRQADARVAEAERDRIKRQLTVAGRTLWAAMIAAIAGIVFLYRALISRDTVRATETSAVDSA